MVESGEGAVGASPSGVSAVGASPSGVSAVGTSPSRVSEIGTNPSGVSAAGTDPSGTRIIRTDPAGAEAGQGIVRVRRLEPDDWEAFRTARIAALRDAPTAFGSTAAQAEAMEEAEWRRRLAGGSTFGAEIVPPGGGPAPLTDGATLWPHPIVGISGGFVEDPASEAGTVELVSMWVHPSARGRRVGEALVEAVVAWAVAGGAAQVHLWVTEGNASALRLYQRCGFDPTGETAPLPSDPRLTELGMLRRLG